MLWDERIQKLEFCRHLLKERALELHRGNLLHGEKWNVEGNIKDNQLIDEAIDSFLVSRLNEEDEKAILKFPELVCRGRESDLAHRSESVTKGRGSVRGSVMKLTNRSGSPKVICPLTSRAQSPGIFHTPRTLPRTNKALFKLKPHRPSQLKPLATVRRQLTSRID